MREIWLFVSVWFYLGDCDYMCVYNYDQEIVFVCQYLIMSVCLGEYDCMSVCLGEYVCMSVCV